MAKHRVGRTVPSSKAPPLKVQTKPTKPQEKQQEESEKKKFWHRPVVWLGTLGTAVLIGVLTSVLSTQAQRVVPSSDATAQPAPHLVVDQVSLSLNLTPATSSGAPLFTVDVRLLNTGEQIAAINSATLTIDNFTTIPMCYGQGAFLPTGFYHATLPKNPSPGEAVTVPVDQTVEANGADRFQLLLTGPIPSPKENQAISLYRVHLRLNYNAHTAPLDLGEILVDYPGFLSAGEYYWNKYLSTDPSSISWVPDPTQVKSCDIQNSHTLHAFLAKPAMRTSEIAPIAADLAYS